MKLSLEITNERNKIELTDELNSLIENVIKTALSIHGIDCDTEVSLLFTDADEIRQINNDYRNTDKVTDVLSFPQLEFEEEGVIMEEYLPKAGEYPYLSLGDVVINVEQVYAQAQEFGHSRERETGYLVTHSILHLLGYDHMEEDEKKRMRAKEEEIMSVLGIGRG
ncbi:MAG: rRNA maturation RNase YbeY [Clostridia bacterium]|nr:rRNA maturation RNase YbeY [Clostridia bacterium]